MILESLLLPTLGKKQFQWLYTRLYKVSLLGMNASGGGDFRMSGELHVCRYIEQKLQKNILPHIRWLIFDVGANKGFYVKELSKCFPQAEIHSFEPSEKTYQLFVENTRDCSNVHPHNFGFGSEKAQMTLYSDSEGSGLSSVYHRELSHYNITMDRHEPVELTTIDDFCRENGFERIHFLKIDVEGHELAVLHGAESMLRDGRIDFIQFEFGGTCIDSKVFFRDYWILLHERYRIYRILKNGIAEIKRYTEHEEIFCTVNFLAEKK